MFDFNNDGREDIFVAGGHVMDNAEFSSSRKSRQPNTVFTNLGSGKFAAHSLPGEALHRGAAFGGFDRDGRIDAVVTRLNEKPVVLHNTSAGGNWIELRLVGHKQSRRHRRADSHYDRVRRAVEPGYNVGRLRMLKRSDRPFRTGRGRPGQTGSD